jgi:hypothetical protein
MFVHVSFQTDGSGQDVAEVPALETSSWIVSHGKMVAQQLSQIKRVIHLKFSVIAGLVQTVSILLFA